MLWQGQEFGENYGLPPGGYARVRAARPVHWEYFYDREGNALVDLYRRLGALRASHPALRSRESYYYHHDSRTRDGVIAYHRRAGSEIAMVVINFSGRDQSVELPFPAAGRWTEVLAPLPAGGVREHFDTAHVGERVSIRVPSNYGRIFLTP